MRFGKPAAAALQAAIRVPALGVEDPPLPAARHVRRDQPAVRNPPRPEADERLDQVGGDRHRGAAASAGASAGGTGSRSGWGSGRGAGSGASRGTSSGSTTMV